MSLGHLGTGFAIRKGISYRRHGDLADLGMGNPFQRWGTDITVRADGRELRLLSVHLASGCWGRKQDGESRRRKTCAILRGQMRSLRAWTDARRAEGAAFVILGDFNRRLALPGDWAWRLLSPPGAPLSLLTRGVASRCNPRYPDFIDHLIAGGGESRRRKTCAILRGQMRSLRAWTDARRAEGAAFVILGDFNRRLALPGDWAWRLLSPPGAPLSLLTRGVASRCNPRYPDFIDHLIAGGGAGAMQVQGSFGELPRQGRHPDHCAVWADFR